MKYFVPSELLGNAFVVPRAVAEKYLKLASPVQLKVILYVFANLSEGIDAEKAADFLKIEKSEAEDALAFWVQSGMLGGETPAEKEQKPDVPKASLPTREDVIRRGLEDKQVVLLMREAQNYFGGPLSQNVSRFLLSLYDDCGMSTSVILFMLSYAASKGKCNLSFVRATASAWRKAGVETVADAEREISVQITKDLAWSVVGKAFGLDKRRPSEKEAALSDKWVNEWKLNEELLKVAYDECVDRKSKFSFAYVAAIIEAWHKEGIDTPEKLKAKSEEREKAKAKEKPDGKYGYAGYDIDKFEEMLNKDD